jgi:hypothetical protein
VAFADGGVFVAGDDLGDAVEDGEVFGLLVAGGGELEGGLFEEIEAGLGEVGLAGGGELEDLGGGGLGVGCFGEAIFEGGAAVKAVEGGAGEFSVVCVFGEFDDFFVDVVVEPGRDLEELVFSELGEGGGIFDRINGINRIGGVHRGGLNRREGRKFQI